MLTPEEVPLASEAVRQFRVALSNLFLYTEANAMVASSLEQFVRSLDPLFGAHDTLTLGVSEGRLVIDGTSLDEKATGSTQMLIDLFKTHELHSLAFQRGTTAEDITRFAVLLKPKALPFGVSLIQVLQDQPIPNILANHRVFVAMDEGSAASLAMGRETEDAEFNAAMEALQYFLQVFSRVKQDDRKQEVGRLVSEQMGEWLSLPGFGKLGPGMGGKDGAGGNEWDGLRRAVDGFQRLLDNLPKPEGAQEALQDLEDAMARLMSLASQAAEKAVEGKDQGEAEDQEALFETDPVITALEQGDLAYFQDPRKEAKVSHTLQRLQEEPRPELMPILWRALWSAVDHADPEVQSLGLRQLKRWKWENLPRESQLDGLRRLGEYLPRCQNSGAFQLVLLLTYGWMSSEWKAPEWDIFNGVLRALSSLERVQTEAFPEQRNKAHLTFQGLFFAETYEELLRRSLGGAEETSGPLKAWGALGPRGTGFLLDKLMTGKSGEETEGQVYGILERLELSGEDVLSEYLALHNRPSRMDVFLRLFDRIIMTRAVANHLRKMWDNLSVQDRQLLLTAAAKWGRKEFRDVALKRILDPDLAQALPALRDFPAFAMPGDSRELLQAAEARLYVDRAERDEFSLALCEVLGRLTESISVPFLQDWAQPKGLLDKRKEKSVAVKTAALKALGMYRSQQVRSFLEKYAEHGEKDLRPVAAAILAETETPPQK